MRDKSGSGKISLHGNGMGVPSPEDIERRAREIAMIDERDPNEFTDADWNQARQELMGVDNNNPPEETDDEAYLSGRARQVTDQATVASLAGAMRAETGINWRLYEFTVEVAMLARRRPGEHGPGGAAYEVWRETAGGSAGATAQTDRVQ